MIFTLSPFLKHGSNNTNNNINIPGYQVIYGHREPQEITFPSKSHGGVALYIKNTLTFRLRDDIHISSNLCESLFIEIPPNPKSPSVVPDKTKSTLIGVIYRSPNNAVEHFLGSLNETLKNISQINSNVIIMGDINIDTSADSSVTYTYLDTLAVYGLQQCITTTTRFSDTKRSTLDHIITSCHPTDFTIGTIASDITDHTPIFAVSNTHKVPQSITQTTQIYDYNVIINTLNTKSWESVYQAPTADLKLDNFLETLKSSIHSGTKTKTLSRRSVRKSPWLTYGLQRSINHKNNMYKKLKRNPFNLRLQSK